MQVSVKDTNGIPEGSILSIRAGQIRRQGSIACGKPMQFDTSVINANPFKIDIFAPVASKRLTLAPNNEFYSVELSGSGGQSMKLQLDIKEAANSLSDDNKADAGAKQERRQKVADETQDYIDKHQIVNFVQNLMQNLLAEKPGDPYAYMEQHLAAVQSASGRIARTPSKQQPTLARKTSRTFSEMRRTPSRGERRNSFTGAFGLPLSKSFEGMAFAHMTPQNTVAALRPLRRDDIIPTGTELRRLRVPHLSEKFAGSDVPTPLARLTTTFRDSTDLVLETLDVSSCRTHYQLLRAGPRKRLFFEPNGVTAAIVTCGGLCPGLNTVVREIALMLHTYGVDRIYGIRGGYKGVMKPDDWIPLTPDKVQDIHMQGGTILVSDRGNPPHIEMAKVLRSQNVNQYFVIGGDGTLKGALQTYDAMKTINHECAVIGVPKTIDNDIPIVDKTFGFDTACTEAKKVIDCAYIEATCNANCIGLVKLMGRHAGYIAMNACLASRNVDICLLPEMDLSLDKVLQQVLELMQTKGYAVIVVAEGCGDTLLGSSGVDAGGNKKMADVGPWLRDQITAKFQEVRLPLSIKYIDPTYMIRAIPPNSYDSAYCTVLAQNAVHAAMAGHVGVTVGRVQMRYCFLPIEAIIKSRPKRVDLRGRWFQRLVASTQQPSFEPDGPRRSLVDAPSREAQPEQQDPLLAMSDRLELTEALPANTEFRRVELQHLGALYAARSFPTPLQFNLLRARQIFNENSWVSQTLEFKGQGSVHLQMLRAGPRRTLHFDPETVAAAIVTCGGLCPGLNVVIRELVMMLYKYGVKKVYGIRNGFKGVVRPHSWITLTPETVQDIHNVGGTILHSGDGFPPKEEMAAALRDKGIRQYYVIGGDGTHKGGLDSELAMEALGHECAVVAIPKTIDSDMELLDRTFGFETACNEAKRAIDAAHVEAACYANCIGLVKLMGRDCGNIALHASIVARHVDMCLLPEMDIKLEKVLEHAVNVLKIHGRAVIVVAEGVAKTIQVDSHEDESDVDEIPDIGPFLRERLLKHFESLNLPCDVKYIDPTYMIRAVPANANDSIYSSVLAMSAVHGAMAGYTNFSIAKVDDRFVWLPIPLIVQAGSLRVNVEGPWFERLVATTQQPNLSAAGMALATPMNPSKPRARFFVRRKATVEEQDEVKVPKTDLVVFGGFGGQLLTRPLQRRDLMGDFDEVRTLPCFHLGDRFGHQNIASTLARGLGHHQVGYMDNLSWSTQSMRTSEARTAHGNTFYQMTRAGPRQFLHFDPHDPVSSAAVVSCGGICPGLNSVIREVVTALWRYGVRQIWGILGGYKGVVEPETWIRLTPEIVRDIHRHGGTILVSDRGNPLHLDMAKVIKAQKVSQLFVLGGDGTHLGAMQIFDALLEVDHECAVVGVPKTIDNDIPMMDQTFGFDTACTEAVKAVESAYVEARSNANCIGLVKLMGRHCGHITLNTAIAAGFVDVCLLPEMHLDISKVLAHIRDLMTTKRHAVVVVAEGCGDTIISGSGERDAGGNKKLADVGEFMKNTISQYLKEEGIPFTIKFIDPTYMIRSVPANSFDNQYCGALAQNAVHGAMAGFSGITVGRINGRYVYLPIHAITRQRGKRVDLKGGWYVRLIHSTKQPNLCPEAEDVVRAPVSSDVLQQLSELASVNSILMPGDAVHRLEVANLSDKYPSAMVPNPLEVNNYTGQNAWLTHSFQQFNRRDNVGHTYSQFLVGGPRERLHFDPAECNAVIVTCGGLCPGLNAVIREITLMLLAYGARTVYGCKGGYKGLVTPEKWINLTHDVVQDIHLRGGSMLVSDRGNPPTLDMARSLQAMGIKQLYLLGGDGTHKGGSETFKAMDEIGHECAVVGVPKTIDNDIPLLDCSFGFNTAITEAEKAIDSAFIEATCTENCIGLVKLMGRHCGFVAMGACLAARNVDICLLPEMDISLPKVLKQLMKLMKTKNHAVIVVAEGCGDTLIQSSGETDAGGNKKLADVGPWLQNQIASYFAKMQTKCQVKYIDPTYMIRAVPSNPNDTVYCTVLGQNAVHAAMAGYTGITVGKVDETFVMVPIHAIVDRPQRVDVKGRQVERLMYTTGQPDLAPGPGDDWALLPPPPPPQEPEEEWVPPREVETSEWKGQTSRPTTMAALNEEVSVPNTRLKVLSGFGEVLVDREFRRSDVLRGTDEIRRLEVMHLADRWPSQNVPSPLQFSGLRFRSQDSWAVQAFSSRDRVDSGKATPYYHMAQAGPRETLFFDPRDDAACAAVLTCGALCPGLNSVVREIVMHLHSYGVQRIYGIPCGFHGIPQRERWLELTPERVDDINKRGGSILGNADGTPLVGRNARVLADSNVRQLFMIGGDGTQRGALQTLTALAEINHACAIVTVPKTVDNDIPIVDKTFGFDTACTEARKAIDAAYVEATCNANCIGLVKVFGREAGFLALNAAMSSRVVDICLLPEMEASAEMVIEHCQALMATKGYAVIVIAEGCTSLLRGTDVDPQAADMGVWLRDSILARFKEQGKPLTIKYIDPTYMIRTVPAIASDSVYCSMLAQHAVHGAMAGFTGICVGKVYARYVYLPIHACCRTPAKRVNVKGRWMSRLRASTGQPTFEPEDFEPVGPLRTAVGKRELQDLSTPMSLNECLQEGDEVHRLELNHLGAKFPSKEVPSPLEVIYSPDLFVSADNWSTQTFRQSDGQTNYLQMLRSGPRETIHFDPSEPGMAAAIVTCGGICPGLNAVIRELVKMLTLYGIRQIYGVIGGFKGVMSPDTWMELNEEVVQDIHTKGGSILVSDRGNPLHSDMAAMLASRGIRQYFVLGGDGTHKGAMQTYDAMQEIEYECAVVGIPKTIDNDIQLLDTSFGFDTACTEAARAIDSAWVEASTNANCIGLVKLMGRHCGFIAMNATLAARNVDICLIPEMKISKEKLLDYVVEVMRRKRQAVIVVAEGCGDTIISSTDGATDAGGNKLLADVGTYLRTEITSHFKQLELPLSIKYIDPTYMIRSVAANANDSVYCATLAQHAVHAAMAGYSGITTGKVDERFVMLPIHSITDKGQRKVDVNGEQFKMLIETTRQPSFEPSGEC